MLFIRTVLTPRPEHMDVSLPHKILFVGTRSCVPHPYLSVMKHQRDTKGDSQWRGGLPPQKQLQLCEHECAQHSRDDVVVMAECPVCQEDGDEDDVTAFVTTVCGHAMHNECLTAWQRECDQAWRQFTCPVCRTNLERIAPLIDRVPRNLVRCNLPFTMLHGTYDYEDSYVDNVGWIMNAQADLVTVCRFTVQLICSVIPVGRRNTRQDGR